MRLLSNTPLGILCVLSPEDAAVNSNEVTNMWSNDRVAEACGKVQSFIEQLGSVFRGRTEGQSLVEFAACLVPLALILTGMFACGLALNNYLELTNAAMMGAQALSVSRGMTTTADPCLTTSAAAAASATNLTASSLTYSIVFTDSSGSVLGTGSSTSCAAAGAYLKQGGSAQVTMTYPFTFAYLGVSKALTLRTQITEIIQ